MKIVNSIRKIKPSFERVSVSEPIPRYISHGVNGCTDAAWVAREVLRDEVQEVVVAIWLNNKNRVLGYSEIARGGLADCPFDSRYLWTACVLAGATSMIIAHNHPSGDPEPSAQDKRMTREIRAQSELMNVRLLDHIVIGDEGFRSLAQMGVIRS